MMTYYSLISPSYLSIATHLLQHTHITLINSVLTVGK